MRGSSRHSSKLHSDEVLLNKINSEAPWLTYRTILYCGFSLIENIKAPKINK